MQIELMIPVRRFTPGEGCFRWEPRPVFAGVRNADKLPLHQLARDLKQRFGRESRIVLGAGEEAAQLRLARAGVPANPEAYRLHITPAEIVVTASGNAGAYYGLQTLREMIALHGSELPCGSIEDEPDFRRRGVYYDCARGKLPTVRMLKDLIERLASWKVNELQLYIKNAFTWRAHPAIGRGFSPYTPQDILDVQEHGRLHHVRFVPSLATLSHQELTLQLPAYRHLAEKPGFFGWEGGTLMCPTDRRTFAYVESLYNEFAPLFEAEDINVCCDEPWELGKGRSAGAVARRGAGRVYLEFLLKLHRLCARHGKRMNVWGDIVLKHADLIPEAPRDMVMLNWDYGARGSSMPRTCEFTRAGLSVMVCPGTSAWQRHGTDMPNALGNVSRFAAIGRREGAEGLLNTDWGDCGHRNPPGVSLHGLAHGAACAWNGRAVDDRHFTERFARRVFGGDQSLADNLRALGSVAAAVCPRDSSVLYHALIEPVSSDPLAFYRLFPRVPLAAHYPESVRARIHLPEKKALHAAIDQLRSLRFTPGDGSALTDFERLALDDCALAARMDTLAAQRCLLGQALRGRQAVNARDWLDWAADMRALIADYRVLWRTRHRPSRLADNLKLMGLAEQEARRIGKG